MKKSRSKILLGRHFLLIMVFALFIPTGGTSSLHDHGYDAAILSSRKDGITNSTDSESIISEFDSPTTINLLLKVHQYEMKKMMKKVDSLESNVQVLNDRVGKQDDEIIALKSIVNQQKNREKREIKSTPLCAIKACAFDMKETTSSVANEKPANCEDLKSIGHTLNGFYLVQGNRDTITLKSKVETIYCDFNKRPSSVAGVATERIGYIDTTSTIRGVQFYVQRNFSLSGTNVNVNFQVERLNHGGAMDLTSGVFTAPVPGTYFFLFSAVKGKELYMGTEVYLYRNDELVASAYGTPGDRSTFFLQSMIELKLGDKIKLVKGEGDVIHAQAGNKYLKLTTHFTGWLMESGF